MNVRPQTFAAHPTSVLGSVARRRDRRSRQELEERYGQLILRFALRRGLDSSGADRVVNEVLQTLLGRLSSVGYDPDRVTVRDYLMETAEAAVRRKLVRRRSTRREVGSMAQISPAAEQSAAEQAWDAEWHQYHLKIAMNRIRAEVSRKAWAAFKLYTAACMDSASVAARVGISIDEVYEANSSIVTRLRVLLAEQACDEG